ncbi:hypothetical protein L1987_30037 [Smallanthus sonchifolius]|uniref:Uncharacterized protein n=1 Tax=Smallanthus sonchifolius TaxID=185202 RepID=A0ACB9I3I1_9ASTR|nr:hypothetical protein L1987_30037 [Smallanthus sonchifolius]
MVSSSPSSSSSSSPSPSSSSSSFNSPIFNHFRRKNPKFPSNNLLKFRPVISQSSSVEEDVGSPDRFLENNSIADYMRLKKGDSGELQTAVVSYRRKFPWSVLQPFLQVDLVSTIHIADKEYFATLQKELDSYDCVLYEMVTSRKSLENRRNASAYRKRTNTRSQGFNIIGFIQRQMARLLMLDFELDCL